MELSAHVTVSDRKRISLLVSSKQTALPSGICCSSDGTATAVAGIAEMFSRDVLTRHSASPHGGNSTCHESAFIVGTHNYLPHPEPLELGASLRLS